MNTDFRNRVVLPILLPLAVLVGIVVVVGLLAAIFLFSPRVVGLTTAVVVAAGFMVAFSLANAVDEDQMTVGRRVVIGAVGILPLLAGGAVALWAVNGGVPEDELSETLPWYYEPSLSAPEGALVGAKNSENFCVFEDVENQTAETCTDTQEVTFPAQPEADAFAFVFNNVNAGVPHNFQIFELAEEDGAPAAGPIIFGVAEGSTVFNGVAAQTYQVTPNTFEEGQQFYYNCVVHPVMEGVLTIGPPAEA